MNDQIYAEPTISGLIGGNSTTDKLTTNTQLLNQSEDFESLDKEVLLKF